MRMAHALLDGPAMKEHEMRERVERFLRRAAGPATVGVTMALAGCGGIAQTESDGMEGAMKSHR